MEATMTTQISKLQKAGLKDLQEKYAKLFGKPTKSRNRTWLWRRIAWRIQELVYGGLSERAKRRLEELMPEAETALRVPRGRFQEARDASVRQTRDPRIPRPGTTLLRSYKGRRYAVAVVDDGFEYERELDADLLLLMGWEDVDDAVDCLHGVVCV